MNLKELASSLGEISNEMTGVAQEAIEEVEEGRDDQMDVAAEIIANALAVAMSQVEQGGIEFESSKDATKFLTKVVRGLTSGSYKSVLSKRMMKFERQGSERTIKIAKRELTV